jgi:ATP-dependent DNA helicase RecG
MNRKQVDMLVLGGEGLHAEFKERYSSKIVQDMVAFSNTKGGSILLGVRDDGTISGVRLTGRMKADITSLGRNSDPAISVIVGQIGEIVVVEIAEGEEKPYSCSEGFFRRLDGVTQKMSKEELRIMFADNDPVPYEEKPARGLTLNDISKSKTDIFTREASIDIGNAKPVDFLKSLNLATASGIMNAGALFFVDNPGRTIPHARLTLLAFKGKNKLVLYDRKDVQDDLLTQFNDAITFLMKHLNIRSEIHGVNRKDIYEIPIEALREAVVNALMHRDYSITGTQTQIEAPVAFRRSFRRKSSAQCQCAGTN